jgi:hypothetical protein
MAAPAIGQAQRVSLGDDDDDDDDDADNANGADPCLHRAMSLVDDVKETLGSGSYAQLSGLLKDLHQEQEARSASEDLRTAVNIVAECPVAINTRLCCKYISNDYFIAALVKRKHKEMKALYVKGQPRLRTLLATKWLEAIVREMLDVEAAISGGTFFKIRVALRALFVMRLGLLPLVLKRLALLKLTPKTLYAHHFGETPEEGDCGTGPNPMQTLAQEPRMLRWFLGLPETAPYPVLDASCETIAPFGSVRWQLIIKAHISGGDDPLVNWPCTCVRCDHPGLPVMPPNERQARFEKIYKSVNQWPITVFADSRGIEFDSTEPLNKADARDFDVMGLRCRDPDRGGGEWWHRTRHGKRARSTAQLANSEVGEERPLDEPMAADLHTMPRKRNGHVRVYASEH